MSSNGTDRKSGDDAAAVGMKLPSYNWSCHKCQVENAAGTVRCVACGFPAFAEGQAILDGRAADTNVVTKTESTTPTDDWLFDSGTPWLFFPEAIPAAAVLACSPFWFFALMSNGAYWGAAILALGISLSVAAASLAYKAKSKWVVYAAMMGVLLTALATNSAPKCN